MPQGSPLWQAVLFLGVSLFLCWEIWRGYRAGIVRSATSLLALVLSGLVGFLGAKIAAAPFGGLTDITGLTVGAFVGLILAVVVFVVVWLLGAILFKRTEHQSSRIFRFLWGVGGAVLGLLIGLVIVWSGISVVRGLGALAKARLETANKYAETQSPTSKPSPPKLASGIVTLQESMELGPVGKVVNSLDPIPSDYYELIEQIGRLSGDQEVMLRFVEYPGIQNLMQNPKMVQLANDPSVIEAAESGNILALLSNKAILSALEDKQLSEEIKKIDLRAALKFALEDPSKKPANDNLQTAPSSPKIPAP